MQRGIECALIPVSNGFGGEEVEVALLDLALNENCWKRGCYLLDEDEHL